MTKSEITANQLIAEAIQKLIDKYKQKAEKERAKVNNAYVAYKGEKYYSDADLMDAYACDVFTSATYDRLLDRLNKAKDGVDKDSMTESEMIVMELSSHRDNLLHEIAWDVKLKEEQAKTDERIKALVAEGNSIREAKAIIENEKLTQYE